MSKSGFDYKEFEVLKDNVEKINKSYKHFIENFLKEMALRALRNTKKRTPVISGELRRGWQISEITRIGDELSIELYNDLEYAEYVEYGHRTRYKKKDGGNKKDSNKKKFVEGYFMSTISIKKINEEIPARYEKALVKWLNSLE